MTILLGAIYYLFFSILVGSAFGKIAFVMRGDDFVLDTQKLMEM